MKSYNKLCITLFALALSVSLHAEKSKDSLSIEIDPSTYLFDGYALHLKKSFTALPKWQFGVGVYAMDFPKILVDISTKNRDKGWEQRLDFGVGFFADYFFENNQQGLFTGFELAHQTYQVTQNNTTTEYATFLMMGYVGYQYDFYKSFYVKPWIGIGYNTKISGSNVVNTKVFEIPSVIIFPTVHVGYKF